MYRTVIMKILFTSLIALSMVGSSGANHCQADENGVTPVVVPSGFEYLLIPGSINGGETDVFSFDAVAGCTYKASFLEADGGSSVGTTGGVGCCGYSTPYATVRKSLVVVTYASFSFEK
jgi:hypothetical protein